MQAKGFIRIFIVALLVVALYQLSFTYLANVQVGNAEEYAESLVEGLEGEEKEQMLKVNKRNYLDSIKNEVVVNLGFTDFTYNELAQKQLSLGLDLKGGVSLLVEVDQADALRQISLNSKDPLFNQAIENTIANQANNQDNFLEAFEKEYNDVAPNGKLSAIFASIEEFKDRIDWETSNADVIKELEKELKAKVEEVHHVLVSRIDEFAVAQPFISTPDDNGRIYIELPGADDSQRIIDIVQTSALLEFYETYQMQEVGNYLFEADAILVDVLGLNEEEEEAIEVEDVTETAIDTTVSDLGDLADLESGLGELEDTTAQGINPLFELMYPALNIDEATGAQYFQEGSAIGYATKRNLDKVKEYLAYEEVQALFPRDMLLAWSAKPLKDQETGAYTDTYVLYALKKEPNGGPALTGDVIRDAYPTSDDLGRPTAVGMSMNTIGANKWSEITADNVGKQVAILLDGKVFSAPVVNQQITGGSSTISGMDDFDESSDLANILKSGKLDAQINILEGVEVGASMGAAAIKSGLTALAIGLVLVLLFMVLYYSTAGIIADVALVVNMILIVGFLASLGAALTLPGMAGIVLTIGMAVDANVIIFERIREEMRKGKGVKLAIADGFSRSYAAIIDANVTTMIAAVILLSLGRGPVKGFAIVLVIGIIASLISAVLLTRLIFDALSSADKDVNFSMSWSEKILTNTNIDFLGKRKIAYIVSGVIILAGIASMAIKGFELGVDFQGGRSYVVAFDQPVETDEIRSALTAEFDGIAPIVKRYDVSSKIQVITSYEIESNATNVDSIIIAKLYNVAQNYYVNPPSEGAFATVDYIESSNKVDTSIADDIQKSALYAGSLGALLIFLYILIRFRKWQFGAGALGAVVHDILIILSLFSIFANVLPFSLEIEQKFIAALLTIIGYSINDTVVVFDRIREYMTEFPKKNLQENVNGAINSTLSRTLMTSLTTFFVVVVLFVVGGEAIRGFSFALLVGVLVGTYSSIFIASSIVVDTLKGNKK